MFIYIYRSKLGQGTLEGNRFKTHSNGTLEIKRIRVEDQGTYLCVVSNVAGRDESQVRVEVKGELHVSHKNFDHFNHLTVFFSYILPRAFVNCCKTTEYESDSWK